jgi:GH24 family phage-related lysozyme (muramidase)
MPRVTNIQERPVEASFGQRQAPAALQVVAHPVQGAAQIGVQSSMNDLVMALTALNPSLHQFADKQAAQDTKDARIAGIAEGTKAVAANPVEALYTEAALPDYIPSAYKSTFSEGYRETVGYATAARSAQEIKQTYLDQRNQDGFDVETFLKGSTEKEFAGINDPIILASLAKQHSATAADIRGEHYKFLDARLTEKLKVDTLANLEVAINPQKSPEQNAAAYQESVVGPAMKTGKFTRGALADLAIAKAIADATRDNGNAVEMLDWLDVKDKDNVSVAMFNPTAVAKARVHILSMKEEVHKEDNERSHLEVYKAHEALLAKDPYSLTDAEIDKHVYKGGPYSAVSAAALYEKRRKAIEEMQNKQRVNGMIERGEGGALTRTEANKATHEATQPYVEKLASVLASGGEPDDVIAATRALSNSLVTFSRKIGQVVPNEGLKAMLENVTMLIPQKGEKPGAQFLALADLAQQLELTPTIAEAYLGNNTNQRDILRNYNKMRGMGSSPEAAYEDAYRQASQESRDAAKKRESNPAFWKSVDRATDGALLGFVGSIPYVGQWLGMAPDQSAVQAAARQYAAEYLGRNGNATDAEAAEAGKKYILANYVHSKVLNQYIKVPPGMAGTDAPIVKTLESFADHLKTKGDKEGVPYGDKSGLTFEYIGGDQMRVRTSNPHRSYPIAISELVAAQKGALELSNEERVRFVDLQTKMKNGTADRTTFMENSDLIGKLKHITKVTGDKLWTSKDATYESGLWQQGNITGVARQARVALETRSLENTDKSSLDRVPNRPASDASRHEVAREFLSQGRTAAALVTAGEDIRLRAYEDPATGWNIGMGYNMTKNASNLMEDFRRAGIDTAQVSDIKSGKASITLDQAKALTLVAAERAEKTVKDYFDKHHPGEWAKIPDNHRAVLTDVAYQVGNIHSFPKAIAAVLRGDILTAGKETVVQYKIRNTDNYKVDTGRRNLRVEMLASATSFDNLMKRSIR